MAQFYSPLAKPGQLITNAFYNRTVSQYETQSSFSSVGNINFAMLGQNILSFNVTYFMAFSNYVKVSVIYIESSPFRNILIHSDHFFHWVLNNNQRIRSDGLKSHTGSCPKIMNEKVPGRKYFKVHKQFLTHQLNTYLSVRPNQTESSTVYLLKLFQRITWIFTDSLYLGILTNFSVSRALEIISSM